ncbi:MAG TPA: HlyD family secretion protein [Candidatus Dormibacteraeota bacterium]|nr:HlyD family secretion protein [Candidatus Dormibacteraeota bacterium]
METREKEQLREHDGAAAPATVEEPARQFRKRWLFIGLGIVVLIVALVFGVPWLRYMLAHEGTDDAHVDADIVQITSKIPERIGDILVATNQHVTRGQLLIVLDDRDELARLQQAKAQYDLALADQRTTMQQGQGGVAQARGQQAQAAAQVDIALSQLPGAQQNYDKAEADLSRAASLVATGDVPREQLDAARAEAAAASSQLHAAENAVVAARAQEGATGGGVTTAQGRLAQASDSSQAQAAKAQLDLALRNLRYTHIVSPIDAFVGEKSAEIGQTVSAGEVLMTLVPSRDIFVTANYKETQMGNMRVGQPVDIHLDAYRGVTFHGHVVSINPASENTYALVPSQNATGNFVKVTQRIPVRISIDDPRPDMPLRPGMSVETYVKVR